MRFFLLTCLLLSSVKIALAQDDLLGLLEDEESKDPVSDYAYATFKTTRIINGQSVELTADKELSFVIQHRFGEVGGGVYELWGLDQSTIRFGLEYGLFRWLNVGFGRSSYKKTYDGYLKAKVLRQQTGKLNIPVTVSLFSSVAVTTLKWDRPDLPDYFSSRLNYTNQILIARKFGNAVSIQLSPSYVHRNLVETPQDQNDVYAIGLSGRVKLTNRMSINAEYFYQTDGYNKSVTFDAMSIGIDLETGGHVFQFLLTNSKGMIDPYFIADTTGDITKGGIFLGFNINRVFTLTKEEK